MEQRANPCTPLPSDASASNRNAKTPFRTPCRRMGLARKSPATSGNWHANKSSPGTVSPYKSPLKIIHERDAGTTFSEDGIMQNQVTPTRNIRTLNRHQLTKKLKTNHSSPQIPNKRETAVISNASQSNEQTESLNQISSRGLETTTEINDGTEVMLQGAITEDIINQVRKRIKEKEEKLKDLKLAHLYKRKHDVNTLQKLICTWLQGCQAALQELQTVLQNQGHQLTIEQLLDQLNIPHELVKYQKDTEDFERM